MEMQKAFWGKEFLKSYLKNRYCLYIFSFHLLTRHGLPKVIIYQFIKQFFTAVKLFRRVYAYSKCRKKGLAGNNPAEYGLK
ncbi:hypothetical protein CWS02_15355 [Enterobacter sp. EA-1]|nr:hypothetical protein CWS02_15355 [Enterobacter sp. EA-1]